METLLALVYPYADRETARSMRQVSQNLRIQCLKESNVTAIIDGIACSKQDAPPVNTRFWFRVNDVNLEMFNDRLVSGEMNEVLLTLANIKVESFTPRTFDWMKRMANYCPAVKQLSVKVFIKQHEDLAKYLLDVFTDAEKTYTCTVTKELFQHQPRRFLDVTKARLLLGYLPPPDLSRMRKFAMSNITTLEISSRSFYANFTYQLIHQCPYLVNLSLKTDSVEPPMDLERLIPPRIRRLEIVNLFNRHPTVSKPAKLKLPWIESLKLVTSTGAMNYSLVCKRLTELSIEVEHPEAVYMNDFVPLLRGKFVDRLRRLEMKVPSRWLTYFIPVSFLPESLESLVIHHIEEPDVQELLNLSRAVEPGKVLPFAMVDLGNVPQDKLAEIANSFKQQTRQLYITHQSLQTDLDCVHDGFRWIQMPNIFRV